MHFLEYKRSNFVLYIQVIVVVSFCHSNTMNIRKKKNSIICLDFVNKAWQLVLSFGKYGFLSNKKHDVTDIGVWLVFLCEIIWRLQVQSWLQVNNKEYLLQLSVCTWLWLGEWDQSAPVDWIKVSVKFRVGSRARQDTPEECRRTHRPKRSKYNNKYEDNGPNKLNDKKQTFK